MRTTRNVGSVESKAIFAIIARDEAHHLSMETGERNKPKEKSWIRKAKKPDVKNRVQKLRETPSSCFCGQKAGKEKVESAPNVIVKTASIGETLLGDAKVERRWCKFVVDTGSNITIVRPDVIETSPAKITPTEMVLRTVTGDTAPVQGRCQLRVTLCNCETNHDVWVASLVEEGIIGLYYLIANNCQVDLGVVCGKWWSAFVWWV